MYQGAAFLAAQLESILVQSRSPAEILILDDGSTDGSLDIARDLLGAQSAVSWRAIESEGRLGVGGNFARGIATAKGPLIALADQDDVWRRDKLDVLGRRFDRDPDLLLVHSDARLVDRRGEPTGAALFDAIRVTPAVIDAVTAGRALEVLLRRNVVTGATVMIRRTLVDIALPIPPGWLHDEWLAVAAAGRDGMATIPDRLIDYRQHEENQVGARVLTWGSGVGRLRVSRRDRNARLLARAEALESRLSDVDPARASLIRAKLQHERSRSALAESRLGRLPGILRILRSGGYRRFGNGPVDALRDLVQPR